MGCKISASLGKLSPNTGKKTPQMNANTIKRSAPIVMIAIFVILFTFPSMLHLRTHLIGDGGDNLEFFNYMHLVKNNLDNNRSAFAHTRLYRYPAGFNLNLGSDAHLFTYIGGLLINFFNPYIVFNILTMLVLFINGIASYFFFFALTKQFFPSIIGTLMYAFSYNVLARGGGYTSVLNVAGFPLLAWSITHIVQRQKIEWRDVFFFFSSLYFLSISSLQHIVTFTCTVLIVMCVSLLFYPKQVSSLVNKLKENWVKILTSALLFTNAFILTYFPYFQMIIRHSSEWLNANKPQIYYNIPLVAYLFPSPYLNTFLSFYFNLLAGQIGWSLDQIRDIDFVLFYGFAEIITFVIVLFLSKSRKMLFLLACFVLIFLFSFPLPSNGLFYPFWVIQHSFPFSSVGEPERFYSTQSLFAAMIVVFGLVHVKTNRLILFILVLLLVGERLPKSYFQSQIYPSRFHYEVQELPGSAVFDIPVLGNFLTVYGAEANGYLPRQYYMEAFFYNKPIVDGYINWPAENAGANSYIGAEPIIQFACDKSGEISESIVHSRNLNKDLDVFLRKYNIRTIVIHKKIFNLDVCYNVRARTAALINELNRYDTNLSDIDFDTAMKFRGNFDTYTRLYEDEEAIIYIRNASL